MEVRRNTDNTQLDTQETRVIPQSLELDDISEDIISPQLSDDGDESEDTTSQTVSANIMTSGSKTQTGPIYRWRAEYFKTFPWIQYDEESKEASCKYPKCHMYIFNPLSLIYSKWKHPSLQSRLFLQHEKSNRHLKQSPGRILPKGQKPFRMPPAPELTDDAIWTRFHCAWWLAKEDIGIHKYQSHLEATLVNKGLEAPKTYKDEKFAWELIELLGKHFRKELQHRIQRSPYFGIMADETTDNSVDQQLIVYIKFLDKTFDGRFQPTISYLDLISPKSASAEDIKVC